jgi:hypothetical protein
MRPDRGRPRARLDDVYRTTPPPETSIRGTREQNVKSAVDSGTAKHDTFLLVSEMRYDRGVARALYGPHSSEVPVHYRPGSLQQRQSRLLITTQRGASGYEMPSSNYKPAQAY